MTGKPTVASGRVQLRRMASATATRMVEASVSLCLSRLAMYFSRSSMVTRPAAPLPADRRRCAFAQLLPGLEPRANVVSFGRV